MQEENASECRRVNIYMFDDIDILKYVDVCSCFEFICSILLFQIQSPFITTRKNETRAEAATKLTRTHTHTHIHAHELTETREYMNDKRQIIKISKANNNTKTKKRKN